MAQSANFHDDSRRKRSGQEQRRESVFWAGSVVTRALFV